MPVMSKPESNGSSSKQLSPEKHLASCSNDSVTFEANVLPYDEGPENPVLSLSGDQVKITFQIQINKFVKMAESIIKHFKDKENNSFAEGSQSKKSGHDLVSDSDSIANICDLKNTKEMVDDKQVDPRGNSDNDCKTIKEKTSETSLVKHQSCTEESSENVLEASEDRSERETLQSSDNGIPDVLHADSNLIEAENNPGFNKSKFSDGLEKESSEPEWPDLHSFRKTETIPVTELNSLAMPGALTKYLKLELSNMLIVLKVSGDCNDFDVDAIKYEKYEIASDTDIQNERGSKINSSIAEVNLDETVSKNENSDLESSVSHVNSMNVSEDVCSDEYLKEKILEQLLEGPTGSPVSCVVSDVYFEPSELTMNNSFNGTVLQTCKVMDKSLEDETKSEETKNTFENPTDSELKCRENPSVDTSPKVSYFDESFTLQFSKTNSDLEIEDEETKNPAEESVSTFGFNSFKKSIEEIECETSEESRRREIETESLRELKTLTIKDNLLNKSFEKDLEDSATVLQMTNKDSEAESIEGKIPDDSKEKDNPSDKTNVQTNSTDGTSENALVGTDSECNVVLQSEEEEKYSKENGNYSFTLDQEKVSLPQDVDAESNILKESSVNYEVNKLCDNDFKSTQTVSGSGIAEVSSCEISSDENSKAVPDVLEYTLPETEITNENLVEEELKPEESQREESLIIKGSESCAVASVSLSKSTCNESSFNVEENEPPGNNIEGSENSTMLTINEDNKISASEDASLMEMNENTGDVEIKPVNTGDEMLAENELTEPLKNNPPAKTADCLNDSDECEKEKSKIQLPDVCIHEVKEEPAENASEMHTEENENCSDAISVSESDESKSVASEAEEGKDEISKLNEKVLSDTDEVDAAPTRVRTRKAHSARYLGKLSDDVIPENSVKNTRSANRSSAPTAKASKFSERVSPNMRSLRNKSVDQTANTSNIKDSEKKIEGAETRKKRSATPEIINKKDFKVSVRASPRKPTKKNAANSEVASDRPNTDTRHKPNLDASTPHTTTGRTRRATKD